MISGLSRFGGSLQGSGIGGGKEGIVLLAEADALALQLSGDEGMTVEPVADLERQKRADAHDHRPEHFIAQVEVVVGIAQPFPLDNAVLGIVGRVRGRAGTEAGALLHDFEDE